jgi:hypothetical protein
MRAYRIGDGIAIGIPEQKPGVEGIFQQRRRWHRRRGRFGLRLIGRKHGEAGRQGNYTDKRPDEIHEEPP